MVTRSRISDLRGRQGAKRRAPFDARAARRSRAEGFDQLWPVEAAYQIKNGLLVSAPAPAPKWYFPAAVLNLPGELAGVDSEKKLLAFAAEYGALGYNYLVEPKKRQGHDPVAWALAHAHTVRVVMELMNKLQKFEKERRGLVWRERVWNAWADYLRGLLHGPYAFGAQVEKSYGWQIFSGDPIEKTQTILRTLINPNIKGIQRRILTGKHGHFHAYFRYHALIELIYWQLANQLERGYARCCKECQRPFVAHDRRQRFCPPPNGVKQSRCATRQKLREWRRRQPRRKIAR